MFDFFFSFVENLICSSLHMLFHNSKLNNSVVLNLVVASTLVIFDCVIVFNLLIGFKSLICCNVVEVDDVFFKSWITVSYLLAKFSSVCKVVDTGSSFQEIVFAIINFCSSIVYKLVGIIFFFNTFLICKMLDQIVFQMYNTNVIIDEYTLVYNWLYCKLKRLNEVIIEYMKV